MRWSVDNEPWDAWFVDETTRPEGHRTRLAETPEAYRTAAIPRRCVVCDRGIFPYGADPPVPGRRRVCGDCDGSRLVANLEARLAHARDEGRRRARLFGGAGGIVGAGAALALAWGESFEAGAIVVVTASVMFFARVMTADRTTPPLPVSRYEPFVRHED